MQLVYWPPVVIMCLYGKYNPRFDTVNGESVVRLPARSLCVQPCPRDLHLPAGEYGVLLGANLTFLISVWAPCLATFSRAKQDAAGVDYLTEERAADTLGLLGPPEDADATPDSPPITGRLTSPKTRSGRAIPLLALTSGAPFASSAVAKPPAAGRWFTSSKHSVGGSPGVVALSSRALKPLRAMETGNSRIATGDEEEAVVFPVDPPEVVHEGPVPGRPPLSPQIPSGARRAAARGKAAGELIGPSKPRTSIMGVVVPDRSPLEASRSFRQLNAVVTSSQKSIKAAGQRAPRHSYAEFAATAAAASSDPLDTVLTHKLVLPAPSREELLDILTLHPRDVLASPRALRIIGALLLSTGPGLPRLRAILLAEFCVELQSFALEAIALLASCRESLGVIRARQLWISGDSSPRVVDVTTAAGATGVLDGEDVDASTPVVVEPGGAGGGGMPPPLPQAVVAVLKTLSDRVDAVVSRYVGDGAPMAVNVSHKCAAKLRAASLALQAAIAGEPEGGAGAGASNAGVSGGVDRRRSSLSPEVAAYISDLVSDGAPEGCRAITSDDPDELRCAALTGLAAALRAAELDALMLMVRGPIFRWLQQNPAQYTQWATVLLRDAAVATLRVGDSGGAASPQRGGGGPSTPGGSNPSAARAPASDSSRSVKAGTVPPAAPAAMPDAVSASRMPRTPAQIAAPPRYPTVSATRSTRGGVAPPPGTSSSAADPRTPARHDLSPPFLRRLQAVDLPPGGRGAVGAGGGLATIMRVSPALGTAATGTHAGMRRQASAGRSLAASPAPSGSPVILRV